jgi:hypothetical protein
MVIRDYDKRIDEEVRVTKMTKDNRGFLRAIENTHDTHVLPSLETVVRKLRLSHRLQPRR